LSRKLTVDGIAALRSIDADKDPRQFASLEVQAMVQNRGVDCLGVFTDVCASNLKRVFEPDTLTPKLAKRTELTCSKYLPS